MSIFHWFLVASILLGVAGQLMLKSGAEQAATFVQQCLQPLTIFGFGAYVLSAVCYIVAIRGISVSIAFPSVSASYVLVGIGAHVLWNEPFGRKQLAAFAFIMIGIYCMHQ